MNRHWFSNKRIWGLFGTIVIVLSLIWILSSVTNLAQTSTSTPAPTSIISPTPPPSPSIVPSPNPTTFHVQVGAEDVSIGLETDQYFPSNLTVNVGDTVIFTLATNEPHTISFNQPQPLPQPFLPQSDGTLLLNPVVSSPSPPLASPLPANTLENISANFDGSGFVSSGLLQHVGDSFSVTFTKAGTYPYLCLIHPDDMKGTIVVNDAGTAYPYSQSDVQNQIDDGVLLNWAKGLKFYRSLGVPEPVVAADGSRTFTVFAAAADPNSPNEIMLFIGGQDMHIKVGDKVTWTLEKNMNGTPHTITFLSGGTEPDLFTVIPQTGGPPNVILNPVVQNPSPASTTPYTGAGYYNSGIMVTGGQTPQTYTLTFSHPGIWEYVCQFHDVEGMRGKIFVSP